MKNIISSLILSFVLAFIPLFPVLAQQGSSETSHVTMRILPEFGTVQPGSSVSLAIHQVIAENWHTYWKNPGDSGEATRIRWILPEGVTAGELQWPVPERIAFGPLMNFGYNREATYVTDLTVAADYAGTTIPVTADIELLVCSDICIPETEKIEFTLDVAQNGAAVAAHPEVFAAARGKIPAQVAWQGLVEEKDNALLLSFTPDAEILPLLTSASKVAFFPDEWGLIQNAAPQKLEIADNKFTISMPRDTRSLSEVSEIKGTIVYETAEGIRKGYDVQTPVAAIADPNADPDAVLSDTPPASVQEEAVDTPELIQSTLSQALLFAFFGGLILNLMPCVFPVLSMKALSLIKMSEREQSHAALYGISYTLGVLVCFGAIAGALIALQQAGQHIGWGFQLQNPILVLLLAYLLFLIGLNLSGFFEITGRLGNLGSRLANKQGYAGTFFTGMLATIVATPCTAPFMGIALGYALLQPPVIAISIFLMLGFGLALPFLLLCLVPPLRKALPRPGAWMESFRQFLAFPMFASAAWLVWVYGQQVETMYGVLQALIGIVLLAFSIWLWKRAPKTRAARLFRHFIAAAFFIVALCIAAMSMQKVTAIDIQPMTKDNQAAVLEDDSKFFTLAAFNQDLSGDKPVFVNMTASWCITCKVNERIALATDATRNLFKEEEVVYYKGDWTNQNPEITDFLKSHGRNGVPLYVFYGERDKTTNQRPEPVVLPQLLTSGLVADIVINQ